MLSSSSDILVRGTLPSDPRLVQVGEFAERRQVFFQNHVDDFARVVGDHNFLHQDGEIVDHPLASQKPLVHGMLTSSLFSSIFANRLSGSVYLSQNLNFVHPVWVGDPCVGRVMVERVRHRRQDTILVCDTQVLVDEKVCVQGLAKVLVPWRL